MVKTYLEAVISSMRDKYTINSPSTQLVDIKSAQEFKTIPNDARGIAVVDGSKTKLFMLSNPKALIVHDDIIRELIRLGFKELFLYDNAIGVFKFNNKLYLAESYDRDDFYAIEDVYLKMKTILKTKFNIICVAKPKEGFYE